MDSYLQVVIWAIILLQPGIIHTKADTNTNQETTARNKPENNASDSEQKNRQLMFNKDNKPPWITGYLNRSVIEEKCSKSKPCFASDLVVPVCATDNHTYLNPGVLICAQQCDTTLKVSEFGFGPCPGHVFPLTTFSKGTMKPETTTPSHESPKDRIKVGGYFQRTLKWLGFHVHDDGGVYLADEKMYDSWWNP